MSKLIKGYLKLYKQFYIGVEALSTKSHFIKYVFKSIGKENWISL